MDRRQYLTAAGAAISTVALAGCSGSSDDEPMERPGGTLVIENVGDDALEVAVDVEAEKYDASVDRTIPAGETFVDESFVTGLYGESVTLVALIGDDGEGKPFEFLPSGSDDSPSEVARLTVESEVEASATWRATEGT